MRNDLKWSSIFVEGYVKDSFFKLVEKERDCWMKDVKEEAFFFLSLLSPIIAITTLFIYEYFYLKYTHTHTHVFYPRNKLFSKSLTKSRTGMKISSKSSTPCSIAKFSNDVMANVILNIPGIDTLN